MLPIRFATFLELYRRNMPNKWIDRSFCAFDKILVYLGIEIQTDTKKKRNNVKRVRDSKRVKKTMNESVLLSLTYKSKIAYFIINENATYKRTERSLKFSICMQLVKAMDGFSAFIFNHSPFSIRFFFFKFSYREKQMTHR